MTVKRLTRKEVYESVHQNVGFSRAESAELVEMVIAEIADALANHEAVKLTTFGTIAVKKSKSRTGRNFQTGERVPVPSRFSTSFKPSYMLVDKMTRNLANKKKSGRKKR